jgi:hypothetical protein
VRRGCLFVGVFEDRVLVLEYGLDFGYLIGIGGRGVVEGLLKIGLLQACVLTCQC